MLTSSPNPSEDGFGDCVNAGVDGCVDVSGHEDDVRSEGTHPSPSPSSLHKPSQHPPSSQPPLLLLSSSSPPSFVCPDSLRRVPTSSLNPSEDGFGDHVDTCVNGYGSANVSGHEDDVRSDNSSPSSSSSPSSTFHKPSHQPPSSQTYLSSISMSFLLLLIFTFKTLFIFPTKDFCKHVFNYLPCIYFSIYKILIFILYTCRFLTYAFIFFIYGIFHLVYKFLTYILILVIFFNLSDESYTVFNFGICNQSFENDFHIYIFNVFNHFTVTFDRDHNFFSLQNYKQSLIFPMGIISTESNNGKDSSFLIILSLITFFFKLLFKKKFKHDFFNIFNFYAILLVLQTTSNREMTISLKNCTQIDFFTIETINKSNIVSENDLHTNFCLLSISKLKYKRHFKQLFPFFQIILLLSGDINPNPGPQQSQTWDSFNKSGLHFIHININSLLPKIDEIRLISKKSNAAVIGITESKLDDSIPNSEINIDNYNLLRCDRNRQGGGVACYIRNDISFNQKPLFNNEIENVFIDILLPKTKSFTVGIFYRPPNKSKFIENITEDFSKLNTENNDLFILGDMNINLYNNGKYILDKNNNDNTTCSMVKAYKEFISTFGLKQLIHHPTRITCNTSSLIDHILTNSEDKISQSGIIDVGLSDHQLIFCTRKLTKTKTGTTKYINSRSMKNYTKELLKEKLQLIDFPNYTNFQDTNSAYSDFLNKITVIINSIDHEILLEKIKYRFF